MADTISRTWESLVHNRKKRILFIVDDDPSVLYYTGMLLQRLDYSVYTTRMAEEVLEIVKFAVPLLILTEVNLGGMDGIAFLKCIKKDPKMASVPVIVYTASADPSLKHSCQESGCSVFLRKPFDPAELYAAVQKATEEKPRRYIRLRACLPVLLGEENGQERAQMDCITALSEEGMYVSMFKPLPVRTQLPMTLFLGKARIRIQGTVLYSFDTGSGPLHTSGMGVKFAQIKQEDRILIRAFIKKEITQDIVLNAQKG